MLTSFSFAFLHQIWMRSLLGNLGCRFSPFITLYPAIPFWLEEFLLKNQLTTLWGFPCMLFLTFPFLLLTSFLWIYFLFIWLICVFSWVYLIWDSLCFMDISGWGKFSTIISSNIFSNPFSFSSSGLVQFELLAHLVFQKSLRLPSIPFILFSSFHGSYFHSSIFQLTNWFFWFCYCY